MFGVFLHRAMAVVCTWSMNLFVACDEPGRRGTDLGNPFFGNILQTANWVANCVWKSPDKFQQCHDQSKGSWVAFSIIFYSGVSTDAYRRQLNEKTQLWPSPFCIIVVPFFQMEFQKMDAMKRMEKWLLSIFAQTSVLKLPNEFRSNFFILVSRNQNKAVSLARFAIPEHTIDMYEKHNILGFLGFISLDRDYLSFMPA